MSRLTDDLWQAYADRLITAEFGLPAALEAVLIGVGLSATDSGGTISHVGADPVVNSALRIGGATIALLTKSVAAAALHRWRGG